MPPGTMSWRYSPTTYISGSNSSGGYTIIYNIRSGVKNGTTFQGTNRTAYLPTCKRGKETLALLIEAFKRKLTFIVGTSQTTGQ